MTGLLHLDDFTEGQTFDLGTVSVSTDEIVSFARTFDPQAFHVDPSAAAQSPFGGLIASGWHTASLFMRLYVDRVLLRSACLGSPGVSDLRWHLPVRADETLRGIMTVSKVEHSAKRPDRGTLWPQCEFVNQEGRVVFSMVLITILRRRQN